jgi:hypothetical protein
MSETGNGAKPDVDHETERKEIDEVQQQLDAGSDGEGLAAEAGRGEEAGLSEG